MTIKLKNALASVAIVSVATTLALAFTGPTKKPNEADSSANSLIVRMAGSGFSESTDSLEAVSNKTKAVSDKIGDDSEYYGTGSATIFKALQDVRDNAGSSISCDFVPVSTTDCNGGPCHTNGFTSNKVCRDKGYGWYNSTDYIGGASSVYVWTGSAWIDTSSSYRLTYLFCCGVK